VTHGDHATFKHFATSFIARIAGMTLHILALVAGHTLCTVEKFNSVASAIADCAFTTSKLPVLLSLEVY
jgi:ubiquinone biosynthesis protein UbiJ